MCEGTKVGAPVQTGNWKAEKTPLYIVQSPESMIIDDDLQSGICLAAYWNSGEERG